MEVLQDYRDLQEFVLKEYKEDQEAKEGPNTQPKESQDVQKDDTEKNDQENNEQHKTAKDNKDQYNNEEQNNVQQNDYDHNKDKSEDNNQSKQHNESLTSTLTETDTSRDESATDGKHAEKKTINLSQKRALLQKDCYDEKHFPHPTSVKPEEVQDFLDVYDLPPFPKKKKMGSATVFSEEQEEKMMTYLADLSDMGVGRTMEEFQSDIQFYYKKEGTKDKAKSKGHVFGK